ncbi:MAG: GIY-YIG nuclease family protein, partial [Candidatus Omnitrophica bacterium]|nr:GIY-YIG nuclease family protein [Candidatus Omnitrophota bacterium]
DLQAYIDFVAHFNPVIKFTSSISESTVNFLDICVTLTKDGLNTSVHYKDTDSHTYLRYQSSHPTACKNSVPSSQLLRLRRLCKEEDDFQDRAQEMMDFFRRREYPEDILVRALERVQGVSRQQAMQTKEKTTSDRVKLVLTYHPHNMTVKKIMFQNLSILRADSDCQSLFEANPLVAFRRDKNLKDTLVHSRLRTDSSSRPGTFPCQRKGGCKTCPHVVQMPVIKFPKKEMAVEGRFTCESRNVIYVIICKRCGLTYIGETGCRLADRFAGHLRDVIDDNGKPVANHFNSNDHKISDIQLTAIKQCSGDLQSRRALENRLIYTMDTVENGINEKHSFL